MERRLWDILVSFLKGKEGRSWEQKAISRALDILGIIRSINNENSFLKSAEFIFHLSCEDLAPSKRKRPLCLFQEIQGTP